MASHQLAIAKAAFAASLLRPDTAVEPLTRDAITHFHGLLDSALAQCSPANVQVCVACSLVVGVPQSLNLP